MHRFLILLAIPILSAVTPLNHALARGGGGGHGGGSHGSAAIRGSGYVNPSYHWTGAYYRRDGTYVPGHYQTNPNGTKLDNYSTVGNVNPWTGKPGWIWPYESGGTYYAGGYSGAPNPNSVWSGATVPPGASDSTFASTASTNPAQVTEVGSSHRSYPRRSASSAARGELETVRPAPPVVSSYHPHWIVNITN
jgi:hypothetical protein